MAIAYVEHPVTKEEKTKLRKEFDTILDIRFAPEKLGDGDKVIKKPKSKKASEK